MCHDLNLIVKAGIHIYTIDRLIGKGRSLVSYFYRSALAIGVLLKKQNTLLTLYPGKYTYFVVITSFSPQMTVIKCVFTHMQQQCLFLHMCFTGI